MIGILAAVGFVLGIAPASLSQDTRTLLAITVYALSALAWIATAWHPSLGRWLTVAALTIIVHLLGGPLALPGAVALIGLPTGLAAALISLPAALAVAAAQSALLLLPGPAAPAGAESLAMGLAAIWATLGLMAAVYVPVYQFSGWSWSQFQQAQRLLEETRDRRAELRQALEDLAAANLQLTRLNRLAQGLRQAAEDARRAKEQFVANVSHELRTPLNMIIGFSEMILQAPETYGRGLPSALLADLSIIFRNSQHLAGLIDDVLDLSQIEAGRMALSRERVALPEIIDAATVAVRPLYTSKGLCLATEVAPDLPLIFCDRTRIREVLLNLLSNAGRFTERGGVRICAWREGSEVAVSVADTGPGIASQDRERLFQPFQQLNGSQRRLHQGSGLGLSISKAFVELHGGRMWLDSELGSGTVFHIRRWHAGHHLLCPFLAPSGRLLRYRRLLGQADHARSPSGDAG